MAFMVLQSWFFSRMAFRLVLVLSTFCVFFLLGACLVDSRCYEDADCPGSQSCDTSRGRCESWECADDFACPGDQVCDEAHRCREPHQLDCPDDMVPIKGLFCIDVFEASRPDASASSAGTDNSRALSVAGVLPWRVENNVAAQLACEASDKDLCTAEEWTLVCQGPDSLAYSYGDDYDPLVCNGIDTFCSCDQGPCAEQEPCPYPGCFHDCQAFTPFHLVPTGSMAGCTNAYGVYDINGNVWEHIKDGNDSLIRGGAYNCSDSERLHRCDYIPGSWSPSARGFRCCRRSEALP